jgi:jagged-like protein
MLGELLSRPKLHIKESYLSDYPEISALNAIIEIKVETAIINENINGDVYLLIVFVGILLLIISSIAYLVCLWHSNHPICSRQSEIDLSVTDTTRCHDEEKSNNLQNEENFRRYANPLKNSTCSLRSSNVELNPIHDLAGPSGLNRSQLSIFRSPKDFANDFETTKAHTFNAPSSMYLKTQNFDVDKNTIESQQTNKDFDKRLNKIDFKCFPSSTGVSSLPPQHNINNNNNNFNSSSNIIHQTAINNSNDTLTLHI